MSAILKFDFQKRKQLDFLEVNYLNYTKRPNSAGDKYIFPKARGNKNTQCVPILTCIFSFFDWLTLTSEILFMKFHPEVLLDHSPEAIESMYS